MKKVKSVSEWVTGLDISSSSLTADTSRVTRPAKRFRKSTSLKSMKHKTLVSDPSVRSGSNNDEAWSTRYPPKSINELCVHKKKISEVQKWLEDAFSIQRNIPSSDQSMILLLTGPSGCGKSAVVHALSHEMPFSILEWTNPVTLPNDLLIDHEFNQSQIKQFTNFILRGNRYPSLSLSSSSTAPKESKVVLIEELPNAIIREPSKLHQLLESIKISSSPLIFIVSSNQTSSLGPSHIFPSRILSLHNIHTISFNPVAHTGLIKGLQRILALEGTLPRLPYKEVIDDIATSCGGDIRNAVNSLQFVWLKKDVSDLFMRSDKENMTDDRREEMRPIGGRDFPLYLFRALGKILYCKRGATPSHYLPPHLSHYDRHDLTAEPEVVYESVNMSCDMFNLYVHQNYIDFFEDIYDTALAIDYISCSDMISSTWTESQVQRSSLEKCGASLCCRGYMFANAHPVGHRWKPLHKPQWNTINRQFIDNSSSARNIFLHFGMSRYSHLWSPVELQTEILPFIALLNKPLKNLEQVNLLQALTNFRGHSSRRRYDRLGETDNGEEENEIVPTTGAEGIVAMETLSQSKTDYYCDHHDYNDIELFDDDEFW